MKWIHYLCDFPAMQVIILRRVHLRTICLTQHIFRSITLINNWTVKKHALVKQNDIRLSDYVHMHVVVSECFHSNYFKKLSTFWHTLIKTSINLVFGKKTKQIKI